MNYQVKSPLRKTGVGSRIYCGPSILSSVLLGFLICFSLSLPSGLWLFAAASYAQMPVEVSRDILEPPDGYVYHGASPYASDVDAYIAALGDPSLYPSVEGIHLAVPGTRPQSLEQVVTDFLERVKEAGRIPHLSFAMSIGDGEAVDDVIARTTRYDGLIRAVGRIIRDYAAPVFVRIGFEFNGPWNGYNQGLYPIAFRRFVDLLREEGAHNIVTIWCYEPNSPGDFDAVGPDGEPLWYPGDEYVDWFGLDLFYHSCFTSVASVGMSSDGDGLVGRSSAGGRLGRLYKSQYERSIRFLDMARRHGKPVMLSEVAAVDAHLTPDSEDPGFVDGKADWDLWFGPFFSFLEEHPEIKGFIYMSQDYRGTRYEKNGWGDSRIQINSFILDRWVETLRDERFIHGK
ncbi:MAG: glycosyl hydrolase [Limnochordia bacterium]